MKNLTILLFSLFFLSLNCEAQELEYNKQYALNGSTLFNGFIDLPNSPYQFAIKTYGQEKNKRFQIGLTVGANFTVSEPDFSGGFGIQVKAGKERFEDFGQKNKWRVFYGVDGVYVLALNSFGDNLRVQFGGGLAPFAGIQYRINDRLSIYTEASYQALLQISPTSDEVSIGINGNFLPPAALWVAFDLYKKEKEISK
ncbi:MAG: hypothetical protein ACI85O_001592 [Saprospiraceae bacterium]|jgi:hypothetical protein